MSETERIESHGGTEHTVEYKILYECEDCGEMFSSRDNFPSTCLCGGDLVAERKVHEDYMKYTLVSGEEQNARQVAAVLRHRADFFEALEANGWELEETSQDSRVRFVKHLS